MDRTRKLIKGGTILSMDAEVGDFLTGDVLIDGAVIESVASDLGELDAEIIDATGMIVMPGLIDTHRHLWQGALRQIAVDWTLPEYLKRMISGFGPIFSAQDVHDSGLYGAVEALSGGVTTVFDWSHIMNSPDHADAAIAALQESGGRSVFGHGTPSNDSAAWYGRSRRPHPEDLGRVAAQYFSSDQQLVTLGMSARGPEQSSIEASKHDLAMARDLGIRASMHIGSGTLGKNHAVALLHEHGLLGDDLIYVHCNTCTDDELRYIADSGGHASVSARVEMAMGHGYPATGRLLDAGVRPSLSIDVVSAVTGSMFDEMRGMLEAERGRRNQVYIDRWDEVPALSLTTRDAIEFATIEGARTLGLEDRVGSLSPGKRADLIMLKVDGPGLGLLNNVTGAVVMSNVANVDSVFVDGQIRKRGGRMLDLDLATVRADAERARDRLLAAAGQPPDGTTALTYTH